MRATAKMAPRRVRARVRGVVQGVGFRPFIHGLAHRHGLDGWVKNDGQGVVIEAEGDGLDGFLADLERLAPPLARIGAVEIEEMAPVGAGGFAILDSVVSGPATLPPADVAPCPDCLRELFEPADRRHLYPFIACTDCGPRYTIADAPPFDRARTAMVDFPLCPDCLAEYRNPADRRFHAQTMACPVCGPKLTMGVDEILARIGRGEIVAVKGLGGFHLVCDARDREAVARLRRRKERGGKPLAVMAANLASAAAFADFDATEAALLSGRERPIVLLRARPGADLSPDIAPALATIGVMLPYTPLHYLLFHQAAGRPAGVDWLDRPQSLVLVMTSANRSGEPLVIDEAGIGRLDGIVDAVAGNDRAIRQRADDSVTRMIAGAPRFIRRGRGFVPDPIRLARPVPTVLAVGGHLKSTLCITRGDEAFVSAHIGDLDNAATYGALVDEAARLLDRLGVTPDRVAHDLHPDFLSTRYAQSLGAPAIAVQHHHAHVAAALAEHGVEAPALGLALDGYGMGPGGESWGGEMLRVDGAAFRRLGHLAPLPQPGGEAAARQPWRLGVAVCHGLGMGGCSIARLFPGRDVAAILALLEAGHVPISTACGRLFDAASALLGIALEARYEGEAPMRLESLVTRPRVLDDGWRLSDDLVLDPSPLLAALIGRDAADGADLFHGTLIAALTDWVTAAAAREGLDHVALTGGCLLNRVLAEGLAHNLAERGLTPLLPGAVPPGDGGLSLGQAWVAALSTL